MLGVWLFCVIVCRNDLVEFGRCKALHAYQSRSLKLGCSSIAGSGLRAAKADKAAAKDRLIMIAIGASDVASIIIIPGAAAKDPLVSGGLTVVAIAAHVVGIGPLRHVARHIEHAKWTAVARKATDRGGRIPAVVCRVHGVPLFANLSTQDRALLATGVELSLAWPFVAPWVHAVVGATRRVFPLYFRRQALASPATVGSRLAR